MVCRGGMWASWGNGRVAYDSARGLHQHQDESWRLARAVQLAAP